MKTYRICNKYKKSVEEVEFWRNSGTKQTLAVNVLWRYGEYLITPEDEEEEAELLRYANLTDEELEDDNTFEVTAFGNWELDHTWDGCSEDVYLHWDHSDEEYDAFMEEYWEDRYSYLEETLGFYSEDGEIFIYNGIEILEAKEAEEE